MDLSMLVHDTVCGGLAAAGFGVLFNISFRWLPLCAASGSLALLVRGLTLAAGLRFEAASFVAALVVAFCVQLVPAKVGVSHDALHVVGCIPMIPGGFAAKALLGLFAATLPQASGDGNDSLVISLTYGLRVIFTIGALATGLAIPTLLLRVHVPKPSRP